MSKSFEQGKNEVAILCKHFTKNRDAFFAPGVKEAHIRQMLIDPLFEALGWDLRNAGMVAPQYREVIPEDSLDVEGQQKAPDYTFRVGTLPKFYVEAKKCGVNIDRDPAPAYQLRRYGWSAKLPLSILTDFEELAVYDCTIRPNQSDKASRARISYFNYSEYPDRWQELWDRFSREAVWSGSFDQFAASKRKRGTSEVDEEFLKEIEGWRDVLARNIALRNKGIAPDDLNTAVQSTINRVVFLRMAEDRRLEPEGQLLKLCEQPDVYENFIRNLCRKADEKYNSGLFHFHKEKDTDDAPDLITPKLAVDDKAFKPILQSLYFAHGSPYQFNVLPVEILGTVYERFLGKVIRLTPGHQAKVEEKPEVRKAGGVYYTPKYIVDYIVRQTVGRRIEGQSPAQLAGVRGRSPLRVLDMACGSGSFLLGAYQHLLDYCLKWYIEHSPAKFKEAVYQTADDKPWRLTIGEKKRILTTHIFGVDIDRQAVEVTKLSLLLQVLEGETDQSVMHQKRLFHDRALPNLSDNIKCGNSLIGSDYFTGKLISDPEEMHHINPFDWKREFPNAIKDGGFDCIIGNPPWGALLSEPELEYLREINRKIIVRMIDSFMYFVHQGTQKLTTNGFLGMILPDVIFYQTDNFKLRAYLLQDFRIREALNMGDVFHQVTRPACILIIQHGSCSSQVVNVTDLSDLQKTHKPVEIVNERCIHKLAQSDIYKIPGCLFITKNVSHYTIWAKVKSIPHQELGQIVDENGIQRGVSPDLKDAFLVNSKTANEWRLEKQKLRRVLTGGKQVNRYSIQRPDLLLIYTTREDDFRELPQICSYIDQFRKQITCKEVKEHKHPVYALHRARNETIFLKKPKIIGVITGDRIAISLDEDQTFVTDGLYLFSIRKDGSPFYLMGILNSKLFVFIYRLLSLEAGRVLAQVKPTVLIQLPIRTIDFSDKKDVKRHDRMVALVEQMLTLHKQLAAAKSESQKTVVQRQIDATDAEIDRLVYELYELTDEEIAIVEQTAT